MLTKESIESFQEIYQQTFGAKLSIDEATEQSSNIIRLYKLVLSESKGDTLNDTKDQ